MASLLWWVAGLSRGGVGVGVIPKLYLSVAGTEYGEGRASELTKVPTESLTVTDVIDETPNTASFLAVGFAPTIGQDVIIRLDAIAAPRFFAGQVLNVQQVYLAGKPANVAYQVNAIDYTYGLNRQKVIGRYTGQSATAIALSVMAGATGYTTVNVQAGLPVIDEITFTNQDRTDALTNLCKRIGAYWFIDYYKDLHLFLTDASTTDPTPLTPSLKGWSEFVVSRDASQWITRVLFEGGGVNAASEVAVGEVILPVDDEAWYQTGGGTVVAGPQRITYTGVTPGGAGSLVGPGASPAAGPALAPAGGTGLGTGTYIYVSTHVTASGESLPSPTSTVVLSSLADPTSFPNTATFDNSGAILDDGFHDWAYTWLNSTGGETLPSPRVTRFSSNGTATAFTHPLPLGPPGTTARRLYRTSASVSSPTGLTLKLVATINDNTTTSYRDAIGNASLGANAPTSNTATNNRVNLSAIAIGPAAVTSRKIYRTIVNGSQLKLLTTIADNTTTTYADSTADGSLGANAPTSDASGLTQPAGQVLAGSTSLIVAGTGWTQAGGGWAVIGNGQQFIRYTGRTAGALTGIPASGIGAVTATVNYNSSITAVAALIGIPSSGAGSIAYPILKGDPINLLAQVDDFSAQTTLAGMFGGDGVQEEYLQDRRMSYTESVARATAWLTLRKQMDTSVRYTSFGPADANTRSGRTISVTLPSPTSVTGTFKIQEVSTTFTDKAWPRHRVMASSTRFSFEDLLRRSLEVVK